MNRKEIMIELIEIFRDILDDENLVLTNETGPGDIEKWDSLLHITIITAIEDCFHIKFRLKEIVDSQNIERLIDLIEKKIEDTEI